MKNAVGREIDEDKHIEQEPRDFYDEEDIGVLENSKEDNSDYEYVCGCPVCKRKGNKPKVATMHEVITIHLWDNFVTMRKKRKATK